MKNLFLLFIIFFLTIHLSFSQIEIEWNTKYDGTSSLFDYAGDMVIDSNNNVYITGNTFVNNTTNGYDTILVKYDELGNEIWRTSFSSGSSNDKGVSIMIINNSIYIFSTYWDKLNILRYSLEGSLLGVNTIISEGDPYDIETYYKDDFIYLKERYIHNGEFQKSKISKIDLIGNIIWTYDSQENVSFLEMKINNSGDLIVVGLENDFYDETMEMYIGNAIILKFNNEGTLIWNNTIDTGYEISDNFKTLDIDELNNIYTILNSNTILKYDNDGNLIWSNTFIHPEYNNTMIHNIKYNDSKLFINGYNYPIASNILTACFDTNGNTIWYNNYFTNPDYSASTTLLNTDNNNNIFSFGFRHDADSRHDLFMIIYSNDGSVLEEKSFNSTGFASESIEKTILKENKIFVLAESNQDIMTMKFLNPYATLSTSKTITNPINLYPNPVHNQLNITISEDLSLQKALIYNNLGQLVIKSNELTIDISKLRGIHFIQIITDKGIVSKKIIIN